MFAVRRAVVIWLAALLALPLSGGSFAVTSAGDRVECAQRREVSAAVRPEAPRAEPASSRPSLDEGIVALSPRGWVVCSPEEARRAPLRRAVRSPKARSRRPASARGPPALVHA